MIRRTRLLEFPVWTTTIDGAMTFRAGTPYELAQSWKIGGSVAICYIEHRGEKQLPLLPSLEAELRDEFFGEVTG